MDLDTRIASLAELDGDTTFLFTVRDLREDELTEALLIPREGDVACWLNRCQHFTHVRLDKGPGAELRDGEILCRNHGAYFEIGTGRCTHGPCRGAYLSGVDVTVEDGDVYLTDPDFDYVDEGPLRGEPELESKSNVEF